jgi:hypothetical protein
MLEGPSGQWTESVAAEIPFPKDDPEAILTVLRIAHLQFNSIPKIQTRSSLYQLAIICDKYDY